MNSTVEAAARDSGKVEEGRKDLYQRMRRHNLTPLWEVLHSIMTPLPATPCVPALWRYRDLRPYLLEASRLISAAEAQRRVLILENPGLPGESRITRSLYAGLQIVLPGEIAPAHRHSAAALRFVLEASHGAYTAVDGERTMMAPGDFVITPSWTWHDHGNDSSDPVVWLDGLDMHLVNFVDSCFFEAWPEETYPVTKPAGSSRDEIGSNMVPINYRPASRTSPVFSYPYERTRAALQSLTKHEPADEWHGYMVKYINPATGDWAMPTIATCMQMLPKGFRTAPYRSTAAAVFAVIEGHGATLIGGERLEWEPRDVFVVPSWAPYQHIAASDAVLFSFSDRATQERLDLFREQRGPRSN
jgi:gentisate 1,2-dioxygenase